MDAFFASVEQVRNPALRGKALIVGGDHSDTRGVVCTASYEARAFGIRSGMSLVEARRRCPDAIFIRGNFEHYRAASERVRMVLESVSPCIEFASIDEAYVDITGSVHLFGGEDALAEYVKRGIRYDIGLPSTVGIASNKLVAKIATNQAKPDGYLRIPEGEEARFMRPLPISRLPGMGPRTSEMMESLGIMTIGALADLPTEMLMTVFGTQGYLLQRAARGESSSEVVPVHVPKSISRETTFEEDLLDWGRIEQTLIYLAERAGYALREQGMEARCISLKVRYADFETCTFAHSCREATCVDSEIIRVLHTLLPKAQKRRVRVRLVGVGLSSLRYYLPQLCLFGREQSEKWMRVLEKVDRIRDRHGFELIRTASSMGLGRRVRLATPSLSR